MRTEMMPTMAENPVAILSNELDVKVDQFTRRRRRDKRKAFGLKMSAAGLGALVTVCLGIRIGEGTDATLKNVALIAGALVGVLNAWDAFYDHRGLWVKRTQTASRLERLRRAFRLASSQGDGAIDRAALDAFAAKLDEILQDDLSGWTQMRNDKLTDKQGDTRERAT